MRKLILLFALIYFGFQSYSQCSVLLDASIAGTSSSNFSITTTHPNELIMISYNGWSTPGLGPVTVDGNVACHINTAFDNNNSGISEVYAYAAAVAGVHNIVCTEAPYTSPYYLNGASSFYVNGCTLTCANIVKSDTAWRKCITGGSIQKTINVATNGSMIYCNAENNNGSGTSYPFTWTGAINITDLHVGNGIESSQAYEPAAVSGNYTIKASNLAPSNNGCGGLALVVAVISCSSCVLPVQLQSFECNSDNGKINLEWETATETNSDHFNIQRSMDGLTFITIARIKAAGNTPYFTFYSYSDNDAINGTNYYRLEEVDFDGNSQIFNTSECLFDNAATGNIFPNPNNGTFTISLKASSDVQTVLVTDMLGKEVYHKDIQPSVENNNYVISLPTSCKGIFLVKILNQNIPIKKLLAY